MTTKKDIEFEISQLSGIKGMVEAYEEIAATRIRRTKDQVIKSREFTSEINYVFQHVKSGAKKIILEIAKKKKKDPSKLSFLQKNGKTLFVFLSANTGLYGDIIKRTFDLFAKYVGQWGDNVAIIGRVGLKMASQYNITKPITYFDFPDDKVDEGQLKKIASFMIQFERIIVFYAKSEGIMRQEVLALDLSGNPQTQVGEQDVKIKYFFEPEVSKIMAFFETEIFSALFEQTLRESQLAKLSSRVVGLNSTIDHIDSELEKTILKRNVLKHEESNKKQIQTFSSMSLWNT